MAQSQINVTIDTRHVGDAEIFDVDQVMRADKISNELVEVVLASVAYPLVLALYLRNGPRPVAPALLPSGDTSLDNPQRRLFRPVPTRVFNSLSIARRE